MRIHLYGIALFSIVVVAGLHIVANTSSTKPIFRHAQSTALKGMLRERTGVVVSKHFIPFNAATIERERWEICVSVGVPPKFGCAAIKMSEWKRIRILEFIGVEYVEGTPTHSPYVI